MFYAAFIKNWAHFSCRKKLLRSYNEKMQTCNNNRIWLLLCNISLGKRCKRSYYEWIEFVILFDFWSVHCALCYILKREWEPSWFIFIALVEWASTFFIYCLSNIQTCISFSNAFSWRDFLLSMINTLILPNMNFCFVYFIPLHIFFTIFTLPELFFLLLLIENCFKLNPSIHFQTLSLRLRMCVRVFTILYVYNTIQSSIWYRDWFWHGNHELTRYYDSLRYRCRYFCSWCVVGIHLNFRQWKNSYGTA